MRLFIYDLIVTHTEASSFWLLQSILLLVILKFVFEIIGKSIM